MNYEIKFSMKQGKHVVDEVLLAMPHDVVTTLGTIEVVGESKLFHPATNVELNLQRIAGIKQALDSFEPPKYM